MGESIEGSVHKSDNEVLDTPDRSKNNQIAAASVSEFEESPVFNFLNNLSPIKPMKPLHISQTIHPLNFAPLSSAFTSPHVSSLRESRLLRRHQLPDPSKPEFALHCETMVSTNEVNADDVKQSDQQEENLKAGESDEESQFVVDPSYSGRSSNSEPIIKAENKADHICDSSNTVLHVPESSEMVPCGSDVNIEGKNLIDQNKEVACCDWDSLISDALMFESPNDMGSNKKLMDPKLSYYMSLQNEMHGIKSLCSVVCNEHIGDDNGHENLSTQPGEGSENTTIDSSSTNNNSGEMDYEHLSGLYRGMRRRCLVFETGGSRRKHSGPDSSVMQPESNAFSNDRSLVPVENENSLSCHHILPGIGLHLNALAATPRDEYRIVNHDSSASARLLIGPGSSINIHSSTIKQEILSTVDNAIVLVESEDVNQASPKKRRRAEQTRDVEGCKRCNCKKSKCLKLYCECFAAGVYCMDLCACIDCFNKPSHEDTVLATRKQIESRNPLAFAPKVIRGLDQQSETGNDSSKTPASARHKRGCNCKKSGCLKKYCECYQGGVGCSFNCRCEGCKNAFGRKDVFLESGSHVLEADVEEYEMEAAEKIASEKLENELDYAIPATPLRGVRQSVQLPFALKKPPKSSFSSGFRNVLGKRSFQHMDSVKEEDEMPGFLQESSSSSPKCGIKSLSPNGKRVSPPHNTTPTGLRSSRKLILQSIPSFPSLTNKQ